MKPLFLALAVAFALQPAVGRADPFYFGADLSFANEMEDCGAVFREHGEAVDPFKLFKAHGTNLVRVRLWVDPDWTKYSTLADVEKTIRRAKAEGLPVLLDFHYSDDWADGDKQPAPKAWAAIQDPQALARQLHDYTVDVLTRLDREGLMPQMVQVGNETNSQLLGGKKDQPIDWARNAILFNAAIQGVRDASAGSAIKPKVMIHIAQPEHVEPWFKAATEVGVTGYDVIGISYYPKWSTQTIKGLGQTIGRLRHRYGVEVMVVETAYPWTLDNADATPNVLWSDALLPAYPATPKGQARYLADLTQGVIAAGGAGVVYWAPDWVSTACKTRWGTGSTWDNATYFDFQHNNEVLPAIDFPRQAYAWPVTVRFHLKGVTVAAGQQPLLWGDFLGARGVLVRMEPDGQGGWVYVDHLPAGQVLRFQAYAGLPLTTGLLKPLAGYVESTVGAGDTEIELRPGG
ncbi:MAG: arabinogalactan endo-1,4-beta-galactosidase [Caulobacteraceae bacterium]|nr:arabinogalactan endo-1,4-beta-galactosidase [Caulobacteraceae bacterium]